jgi:hypothetical protein
VKRKGRTLRGNHSACADVVYWDDKNVRTILRDERYTGVQVSGKTRKPKPGSRNTRPLPESEWIKVAGAHEAIVPEDVFARANAGTVRYKNSGSAPKQRILFAGKTRCGHCGRALKYRAGANAHHYCAGAGLNTGAGCFDGNLYVNELKGIVLAAVKTEAKKVLDGRKRLRQTAKREPAAKEAAISELKQLAAQIGFLERRGVALYEEYADGKLDRDGYLTEKTKHAAEPERAEARAGELNGRIAACAGKADAPADEPLLRSVPGATDVTDGILSLVDCVTVYDPGRIEIKFAFGDTNIAGV